MYYIYLSQLVILSPVFILQITVLYLTFRLNYGKIMTGLPVFTSACNCITFLLVSVLSPLISLVATYKAFNFVLFRFFLRNKIVVDVVIIIIHVY